MRYRYFGIIFALFTLRREGTYSANLQPLQFELQLVQRITLLLRRVSCKHLVCLHAGSIPNGTSRVLFTSSITIGQATFSRQV